MRLNQLLMAAVAALSLSTAHAALDAGNQYNLDQIRSGSPGALNNAAQNVARAGAADPQVLDALAESLLQNQTQMGDTWIEGLSWDCKALAATGQKRYYTALRSVADNDAAHRKLRKWCDKSADNLGSADGEQYAKGMVSIAAQPGSTSTAAAPTPAASSAPPAGGYKPITAITVNMSMQEVNAISGPPNSTNAYITGKAFIPFNFRGKDSYRSVAHYKGQGRIIFSNSSAYSSDQRVLEVQIDPNESGYP
jgi:hypothetical protein